jgi:hypothetical protein
MSQPDFRDEGPEDAPLDPATERVQAKLKRLLLGSSLIMFAGFIAVFAAILYKINTYEADPSEAAIVETLNVGADAEVLQATISAARPSSSGLGRRPFTAETRVRVPLGVPISVCLFLTGDDASCFIADVLNS